MKQKDKTVLVVDDRKDVFDLVRALLKNSDCELIYAENGAAGLEAAREKHPDLVLLDIMMPRMDGFDCCRYLKSDPATSDIPVVFLSARSGIADTRAGMELGADAYLTKPFRVVELRQLVERITHRPN